MELNYLVYFRTVAKTEHISQAAAAETGWYRVNLYPRPGTQSGCVPGLFLYAPPALTSYI